LSMEGGILEIVEDQLPHERDTSRWAAALQLEDDVVDIKRAQVSFRSLRLGPAMSKLDRLTTTRQFAKTLVSRPLAYGAGNGYGPRVRSSIGLG
jgi:hypothetical protein